MKDETRTKIGRETGFCQWKQSAWTKLSPIE